MKKSILATTAALGLSLSSASAIVLFDSVETLSAIDGGAPIVEGSLTTGLLNPMGQSFVATADTFAGVTVRFTNKFLEPTDTFNVTVNLYSEADLSGTLLGTATVASNPFGVTNGPGNQIEATQDIEVLLPSVVNTVVGESYSFSIETDTNTGYIRSSANVYSDGNLLFSSGSTFGTFGADLAFATKSVVPEPSTYAAIFGGLALLLAGSRRRLRHKS